MFGKVLYDTHTHRRSVVQHSSICVYECCTTLIHLRGRVLYNTPPVCMSVVQHFAKHDGKCYENCCTTLGAQAWSSTRRQRTGPARAEVCGGVRMSVVRVLATRQSVEKHSPECMSVVQHSACVCFYECCTTLIHSASVV